LNSRLRPHSLLNRRHTEVGRVSVVWENVDLKEMRALLDSPEERAAEAKHVMNPIEI
jgi:hypothetical protein